MVVGSVFLFDRQMVEVEVRVDSVCMNPCGSACGGDGEEDNLVVGKDGFLQFQSLPTRYRSKFHSFLVPRSGFLSRRGLWCSLNLWQTWLLLVRKKLMV